MHDQEDVSRYGCRTCAQARQVRATEDEGLEREHIGHDSSDVGFGGIGSSGGWGVVDEAWDSGSGASLVVVSSGGRGRDRD